MTGPWVGVEHEYEVLGPTGEAVDFRNVLPDLDLGVGGLDPGDPLARRCAWGGVVTADGPEAEIATPPVEAAPGFASRLGRLSADARAELERALPPHLELRGYSTHLSVELPDHVVVRAARRFLAVYAAPTMLLVDNPSSPGILVRPRRGRLELCGDHTTAELLVAATVFVTAAALDCGPGDRRITWAARRRTLRCRPVRVEPAVVRYGWYVDRTAFGPDLYGAGRATQLPDHRSAQDQLEATWTHLRAGATAHSSRAEIDAVDRVVSGALRLPCDDVPAGAAA